MTNFYSLRPGQAPLVLYLPCLLAALLLVLPLVSWGQVPSISTILNPDGTLRAGTSGSFDARGYQLRVGVGGQPILLTTTGTTGSDWTSLGGPVGTPNGVNGPVLAVAVSGNTVYVGGNFTMAGGVTANGVAQWDGAAWHSLGTGTANGVSTGGGSNGIVWALAVSGSTLYVGGTFTRAGGVGATNIARWDGTAWRNLGTGVGNGINDVVHALAVSGSTVYAGGDFTSAGGVAVNGVAQWGGTAWSSLGTGARGGSLLGGVGHVYALAVSGSTLYMGGLFFFAGGNLAYNIAQWDGTTWSSLGTGSANGVGDGRISTLAVSGSTLYVGGYFTTAGGGAANRVAQWDGTAWHNLGTGIGNGINDGVVSLIVSGGLLYAGGYFTTAGGSSATNIAQWDGTAWRSLGTGADNGVNDGVNTLAVRGSGFYAGGKFTMAGGVGANRIAFYLPTATTPLAVQPRATSGGLALYPNPASGSVVQLTGAAPGQLVQVLDVLGQVVATAVADGTGTLSIKDLALGLYVVRVGTSSIRLLVQ